MRTLILPSNERSKGYRRNCFSGCASKCCLSNRNTIVACDDFSQTVSGFMHLQPNQLFKPDSQQVVFLRHRVVVVYAGGPFVGPQQEQ